MMLSTGVVDLSDSLTGPVFEPLRDNAFLRALEKVTLCLGRMVLTLLLSI